MKGVHFLGWVLVICAWRCFRVGKDISIPSRDFWGTSIGAQGTLHGLWPLLARSTKSRHFLLKSSQNSIIPQCIQTIRNKIMSKEAQPFPFHITAKCQAHILGYKIMTRKRINGFLLNQKFLGLPLLTDGPRHWEKKNSKTCEATILHLAKRKIVCNFTVSLCHLQSWEIFNISPGSNLKLPFCGWSPLALASCWFGQRVFSTDSC